MFDLEGTVVDSNIVQQQLWVRAPGAARRPAPPRPGRSSPRCPRYLAAERRDRGEFLRTFLRRYAGMPAARLEARVRGGYTDMLLAHTSADALERVGSTAPPATAPCWSPARSACSPSRSPSCSTRSSPATMHEERRRPHRLPRRAPAGRRGPRRVARASTRSGTGSTCPRRTPTATASRPRLARLLGNPSAVNPDARLAREAQRKQWDIHTWKGGGRTRLD